MPLLVFFFFFKVYRYRIEKMEGINATLKSELDESTGNTRRASKDQLNLQTTISVHEGSLGETQDRLSMHADLARADQVSVFLTVQAAGIVRARTGWWVGVLRQQTLTHHTDDDGTHVVAHGRNRSFATSKVLLGSA